jgi:hypothetical protein
MYGIVVLQYAPVLRSEISPYGAKLNKERSGVYQPRFRDATDGHRRHLVESSFPWAITTCSFVQLHSASRVCRFCFVLPSADSLGVLCLIVFVSHISSLCISLSPLCARHATTHSRPRPVVNKYFYYTFLVIRTVSNMD